MGLKVDTVRYSGTKSGITPQLADADKPVSIFGLDAKDLAIAGGVATAVGLSLLAGKKIPASFNLSQLANKKQSSLLTPEMLKQWATSTEPLTKKEIDIARREAENFIESLNLKTISKKVKVKLIDTSDKAGGIASPAANTAVVDKSFLTDKIAKVVDKNGKMEFWEFCGNGTNTQYPMISTIEALTNCGIPQELIRPLTKLERLNLVKSLAAHEAFHLSQFRRMLLHPDIGMEKMLELLKIGERQTLSKKEIQNVIKNKNVKLYKRLLLRFCPNLTIEYANKRNINSAMKNWKDLLKQPRINPDSESGKQTMEEYLSHRHFLLNKPNPLSAEYHAAYTSDLLELNTYKFQSQIIKDHNLLS